MIGIYLIVSVFISLALFFNRNRTLNYLLVTAFVLLQWGLTVYEYNHRDIQDLGYFTPDALAIIFLISVSLVLI